MGTIQSEAERKHHLKCLKIDNVTKLSKVNVLKFYINEEEVDQGQVLVGLLSS